MTTEEKGALDDWYVHNASFWLDLRIAFCTLAFLLTSERRSERAVRAANILQQANTHSRSPQEPSRVEAYQRAPVHRRPHRDYRQTSNPQSELALLLIGRELKCQHAD